MKSIIDRVLAQRKPAGAQRHPTRAPEPSSEMSSQLSSHDIEKYYLKIITDCLRRLLLPEGSFEVGVRRTGMAATGLTTYAGFVRLLRWDPVLSPVLLQNIPVIDDRVRQAVAASVLLEFTHFAGLWFQAGSTAEGAPRALQGMPAELVRQPRAR